MARGLLMGLVAIVSGAAVWWLVRAGPPPSARGHGRRIAGVHAEGVSRGSASPLRPDPPPSPEEAEMAGPPQGDLTLRPPAPREEANVPDGPPIDGEAEEPVSPGPTGDEQAK